MERWRNSAVCLVRKTTDGMRETGSGILVARDLVLTARHVVLPQGCEGLVRLRFTSGDPDFDASSGEKGNGFHNAAEDGDGGVVWNCPKLDLALVKCKSPPDVCPISLAKGEPQDGKQCFSEAFPKISDEQFWKCSKSMFGELGSIKNTGRDSRFTLELKTERRNSKDLELDDPNWSGASGGPVVVLERDDQPRIIGVIISEDIDLNTSLDASPVSEVWKDASFRNYFHCVGQDWECQRHVILALQGVIRNAGAKEQFEGTFGEVRMLEDTAAALPSMPIQDVLEKLIAIFDELENNQAAQRSVYRLACAIASASRDSPVSSGAGEFVKNFFVVHASSKTGVAVATAQLDGKPVSLKRPKVDGDLPAGVDALEAVPEGGPEHEDVFDLNDIGSRLGADIQDALRKTGVTHPKSFLKKQSKRGGLTPFHVPISASTAQDQALVREAAKNLDLEHVRIVVYDETIEPDDEERLGYLRDMYVDEDHK